MILLSEMIQNLREELSKAQSEGKRSDFKFQFDTVELELSIVITSTKDAKAGVKFWVIDAGGGYKNEDAQTQKLKLVLKPGSSGSQLISNQSTNEVTND